MEQKADTNSKDDLEVCFFNFFCEINSMHQQLFTYNYTMMCGCHHGNHLMYLQGEVAPIDSVVTATATLFFGLAIDHADFQGFDS